MGSVEAGGAWGGGYHEGQGDEEGGPGGLWILDV